jgi:hypothetical protein
MIPGAVPTTVWMVLVLVLVPMPVVMHPPRGRGRGLCPVLVLILVSVLTQDLQRTVLYPGGDVDTTWVQAKPQCHEVAVRTML